MSNNEEVHNSMFLAVSCCDLEQVEELVNRHGLSYSPDFDKGYALLLNATLFGYIEIVEFLLEKGATVCSKVSRADTPLHFAAWFGNLELTQLLIDYEARIDAKDSQFETPLHIACHRGHPNVVKLLLNQGANPNVIRELPAAIREKYCHLKFDQAAAASACLKGHNEFSELVEYGAQIDGSANLRRQFSSEKSCRNEFITYVYRKSGHEGNVTPLHIAAEMGHIEIVELLLNSGAHVNAQTNQDSTPLLLAAVNGHKDVAKLLLEHDACVNTNDDDFMSPLCLAVKGGHPQTVKCLLDWGAVIDDVHPDFSILHYAVGEGTEGLVPLFLSLECYVFAEDECGNTPISYPLTAMDKKIKDLNDSKRAETIQLLLDRGADLKEAPGLLHKAVMHRNIDVCQTLISNRVDVNALINNNISRRHKIAIPSTATFYQYVKTQYRAYFGILNPDVLLPDEDENITPLQLACHLGYREIAVLLLRNGANTEARQRNGLTPLQAAAGRGQEVIVKTLLKFSADIDAQGASNETALHYAVMGNRDNVVPRLLENGCDPNIESVDGATAFELAVLHAPQNDQSLQIIAPSGSSDRHQSIIKAFKYHLVKLKAAGIYVRDNMMQLVNFDPDLVEFQRKCKEEVGKMKREVLLDKVTLHSVFMRWSNPKHMRNASVVKTIEAFDSKYPIYKNLLLGLLKKNRERIKLLDSGKEWLQVLLKTRNALNVEALPIPAWPELEEIVSYLSKKDLLSLISCGENLKKQFCQ